MASMRRTITRHIDSAEAKQDRKHRRSAAKARQIAQWKEEQEKAQGLDHGDRTAADEAQAHSPPQPRPGKLRHLMAQLFGRGMMRRTQGK